MRKEYNINPYISCVDSIFFYSRECTKCQESSSGSRFFVCLIEKGAICAGWEGGGGGEICAWNVDMEARLESLRS